LKASCADLPYGAAAPREAAKVALMRFVAEEKHGKKDPEKLRAHRCLMAFCRELFFPASVLGPVESWALRRLASIFFNDTGWRSVGSSNISLSCCSLG
jgi:hypothetical protein